MRPPIHALVALVAAGACVDEHDVDVYVVLPALPDVCALAGVGRVELAIEGPGPESFSIRSEICEVLEGPYSGFTDTADGPLRFSRLEAGFFFVTIVLTDDDGTQRGDRSLPFDSRESDLFVPLDRVDLWGWQTTSATVHLPACDLDPTLAAVHLELTPALAYRPLHDVVVPCARPGPTRATFDVPLGPIAILAEGTLDDGTPCYAGALDGFFDEVSREADLALQKVCP